MGNEAVKSKALANFEGESAFQILASDEKDWIRNLASRYMLSFGELRLISESARDLSMWNDGSIQSTWSSLENECKTEEPAQRKKNLITSLQRCMSDKKSEAKSYEVSGSRKPKREPLRLISEQSEKSIFGMCPVASEKTVCCNLKTIDVVENCAFGCSYCTIQTFYGDQVTFDAGLRDKLSAIQLDPGKRYHIGTGQSSDSLVWGNKNGILDDLCEFAQKNPNILLEFKTKSANASYFLKNKVPPNIVCSWSLNTNTIIENEEHFTAPLEERLHAAEKVTRNGTRVAFHFHPMVYYKDWENDYRRLGELVLSRFAPENVLFISFGSVTFIKPVVKQIRRRGEPSKILQMEMVKDPHGKLTYPDDIKLQMFRNMYDVFKPWRELVFQYLCMERAFFWDEVFGWHYPTNEEFELALLDSAFSKLPKE